MGDNGAQPGRPPRSLQPLDFSAVLKQQQQINSYIPLEQTTTTAKCASPVLSEGMLKFGEDESDHYKFSDDDLLDYGEIGSGAFGTVSRMMHIKSGRVMAVKRIRSLLDPTKNDDEKQCIRDLDVIMKSANCLHIVSFYGAIFREGDCWICMELMSTSLEKLYHWVFEELKEQIPETIIGRVAFTTLSALQYLKSELKIIHRDVKPSNILLDRKGNIKLCDFGIAGELKDSIARTQDVGCRPYMAPEKIDPARSKQGYDVRSDVWSFGITIVEIATGRFPYPEWDTVFQQLEMVVNGDPPTLPPRFSTPLRSLVCKCLMKDEQMRPKFDVLLADPFVAAHASPDSADVAGFTSHVLDEVERRRRQGGHAVIEYDDGKGAPPPL